MEERTETQKKQSPNNDNDLDGMIDFDTFVSASRVPRTGHILLNTWVSPQGPEENKLKNLPRPQKIGKYKCTLNEANIGITIFTLDLQSPCRQEQMPRFKVYLTSYIGPRLKTKNTLTHSLGQGSTHIK